MNEVYTLKYLTLGNLRDSKTGDNIVLDLTNATLPERHELKKAGDAGKEAARKLQNICAGEKP